MIPVFVRIRGLRKFRARAFLMMMAMMMMMN